MVICTSGRAVCSVYLYACVCVCHCVCRFIFTLGDELRSRPIIFPGQNFEAHICVREIQQLALGKNILSFPASAFNPLVPDAHYRERWDKLASLQTDY